MGHTGRLAVVLLTFAATTASGEEPIVDPDTQIARRRFDRGTELYGAERYAEAVVEFEAARAVKPLPAFDYNIGLCHDRLEHPEAAVEAYQRYVAAKPDAPDAARVRERIGILKERIARATVRAPVPPAAKPEAPIPKPAPPPATATVPAVPSPATARPRRVVAGWVLAAGAAGLAVGWAAALGVAEVRYADANACAPSCRQEVIDGVATPYHASWGLLGGAVLLGASSVVAWLLERRPPVRGAQLSLSSQALQVRF
jgi:tetratricopeptide (TPR) repeat protein